MAQLVGKEATAEPSLQSIRRSTRRALSIAARLLTACLLIYGLHSAAYAQTISPDVIRVSGDSVYTWQIGDAEASLLEGSCALQFADRRIHAGSILVVVDGDTGNVRSRIVVGGLIGSDGRRASAPASFTLRTLADPQVMAPRFRGTPESPPELLQFLPATESAPDDSDGIQLVQFEQPIDNSSPAFELSAPNTAPETSSSEGGFRFLVGGGTRAVEILPRGASMSTQFETINRIEDDTTVVVGRGGVTVLVRDVTAQLPGGEMLDLGTVSLSADRIVAWMPPLTKLFSGSGDFSQATGELYLEGDIVFRQGERIIYADSMYYDISTERGLVLEAEAITTVPEYQGIVRLKADVMQQVSKGNFIAFDAAVTSSRMGVPRYWLQSEQLTLTDRERLVTDPLTGLPSVQNDPFLTSTNNFVYVAGVPILYWPSISTSLKKSGYYVSGAKFKNDDIFGTQILLDFDLFQLFGIENAPPGVDWDLSTDYLSDRGPALGTTLKYRLPGIFGVPGPVNGFFDAWVIDDRGKDTLGGDRRKLRPEETTRGRVLLRHRHYLPNDFEAIAEVGWLSDRNFLEQYLENEWDRELDHATAFRLRKYFYSHLFDLTAQVQVNDFFTETEQLPTFDHYLIGGSLLADWFTWSAHNQVGYSRLNVGDPPTNPADAPIAAIPGESNNQGVVARTRQELAMPVQTGPIKFVPFISGEAAHYGEATDGDSLTRLLGQAGVRASLPMWRVDPTIQSSLLNVRGLAHKMEWTAEYFYADSDTNLTELPLYDPLDDNAQEQFRKRFVAANYGGSLPGRLDPRTYAFRHGFQGLIASPSDVIADDLQQARVGLHQRWQTKRGLPGRERIVDLLQFDVDFMIFPDADRDNFGETLGPTTYDVRYHIGDRVTLLSDGYFDIFDDGLRSISAGVRSSRPGLGDLYVGLLSLEGPVSSTVLRSTVDYRLNEKWIASAGTTYDFGSTGNVGQTLGVTRIGESLLLRLGVNVDSGRDNVGVGFSFKPRFWPSPRLGRIGGQLIPPPGVEGLE